jgi:hypothetical protein
VLFVSKHPNLRVVGHQFVSAGTLCPEAIAVARRWHPEILLRPGVTEKTWTLEVSQFDTAAWDYDEAERLDVEAGLRNAPDVLHARFPGEMLCLRCGRWSREDPVKVEKIAGRFTWTCPACRIQRQPS